MYIYKARKLTGGSRQPRRLTSHPQHNYSTIEKIPVLSSQSQQTFHDVSAGVISLPIGLALLQSRSQYQWSTNPDTI